MSAKPKAIGNWYILVGYWDFVKLRGWMDRNTEDFVNWRHVGEPPSYPCLVATRENYNGGGYLGEFIYVTGEEAQALIDQTQKVQEKVDEVVRSHIQPGMTWSKELKESLTKGIASDLKKLTED